MRLPPEYLYQTLDGRVAVTPAQFTKLEEAGLVIPVEGVQFVQCSPPRTPAMKAESAAYQARMGEICEQGMREEWTDQRTVDTLMALPGPPEHPNRTWRLAEPKMLPALVDAHAAEYWRLLHQIAESYRDEVADNDTWVAQLNWRYPNDPDEGYAPELAVRAAELVPNGNEAVRWLPCLHSGALGLQPGELPETEEFYAGDDLIVSVRLGITADLMLLVEEYLGRKLPRPRTLPVA